MFRQEYVTGKELCCAGRLDRPPGAPSASPAIADKAEKQQSRRQRAQGLGRESGLTGLGCGRARGHGGLIQQRQLGDKGGRLRQASLSLHPPRGERRQPQQRMRMLAPKNQLEPKATAIHNANHSHLQDGTMVDMTGWLRERLSRRAVLAAGIAAAGTSAVGASGALGQTDHSGHSAAVPAPSGVAAQPAAVHSGVHGAEAHGAMMTVGEVDSARNGFDPTAMLTDWDTGSVPPSPDGRTLRTFEIVAEDKEIEIAPGADVPGLDLQWPGARTDAARDRRRSPADRLQELRLAPALDAFPRHPRGAHGRRAGRRPGRSGRGVRLRVRRQAVRLPPLPLPRAAAEAAHAQGHVRRLRHRSRSGPPSRACRRRALAPARHAGECRAGRKWSW